MKSQTIETTVQPSIVNIRAMVKFGDDNSASFLPGAKVTPEDIGRLAADEVKEAQGKTARAINVLRLARQLPAVSVPKTDEKGKAQFDSKGNALVVKRDAIEVAKETLRRECATESAYQNVVGMLKAFDYVAANNLPTDAAFKLKESINYLETIKVADPKTLKLSFKDPVARAIKDGKGLNALRPVIQKAKEKANAAAKASGNPLPFKVKETPAPSAANAGKGGESLNGKTDSAEAIGVDLAVIGLRMDKLLSSAKEKHGEVRKALQGPVDSLWRMVHAGEEKGAK